MHEFVDGGETILWSWIWTDDPFLALTELYRGPLCRLFHFLFRMLRWAKEACEWIVENENEI